MSNEETSFVHQPPSTFHRGFTRPKTRVIGVVRRNVSIELQWIDWSRIRSVFSDLFDAAAQFACGLALDQDDVELERYFLIAGPDGGDVRVLADRLHHPQGMASIIQAVSADPHVVIRSVEIEILVEIGGPADLSMPAAKI